MRHTMRGAVMSEYIIVSIFLACMVFYGLTGGELFGTSTDVTTSENYIEVHNPETGTGQLKQTPARAGGLVQIVHQRGEDFADKIYQP